MALTIKPGIHFINNTRRFGNNPRRFGATSQGAIILKDVFHL